MYVCHASWSPCVFLHAFLAISHSLYSPQVLGCINVCRRFVNHSLAGVPEVGTVSSSCAFSVPLMVPKDLTSWRKSSWKGQRCLSILALPLATSHFVFAMHSMEKLWDLLLVFVASTVDFGGVSFSFGEDTGNTDTCNKDCWICSNFKVLPKWNMTS